MSDVIDLFAGPGGWDLAAIELGIRPLGIEWDAAACATRAAAGLRTLQADVAELDPLDFAPCVGLIASPPCQAFSMAGNGEGRDAIEVYRAAIADWKRGVVPDRARLDAACADERAHLVLEPLRWAFALRPRWVALEQVKEVLPVWEAMADALRSRGYATWTGKLTAEQYDVPQTRVRAFLLASLDGPVHRPPAVRQRYIAPRTREEATDSLFDAPEPARIVAPEDRHLRPWVSMAEALGWGMTARPYPVIAGGTGGGPDLEKVGGSEARATIYQEQLAGRWAGTWQGFGHRTKSGAHEDGAWVGVVDTGNTRSGQRTEGRWRDVDEPAPCLTSRGDQLEWRPTHYDSRQQRDGRTREPNRQRAIDEPAPTIAGESRNDSWVHDRPATTVQGDMRVWPPGHKTNAADERAGRDGYGDRAGTNAVRVTLAEALILQSFPPDYPVQGTKTKQFEQVGNAVPPALAWHVLRAIPAVA